MNSGRKKEKKKENSTKSQNISASAVYTVSQIPWEIVYIFGLCSCLSVRYFWVPTSPYISQALVLIFLPDIHQFLISSVCQAHFEIKFQFPGTN